MRYVLGVIGMIILGVIAVILFGRMLTNQNQPVQVGRVDANMKDYINDKSNVEFVQYGSVVADEERHTLKIYVSEKERSIEIRKGYEETLEKKETLYNNPDSYSVFMQALAEAGFTRKQHSAISDPVGFCPNGLRYQYILESEDKEVSNLWNTTCQPFGGTLGNNGVQIKQLFQQQIPDYSNFVKGVKFYP